MRSILIILVVLLWSTTVQGSDLPEEQRTAEAKRWLAVAFIAEAGWKSEKDHRAIFHVLKRRWQQRVKRTPKLKFVRMVQNYVAMFDSRTEKAGRVRWLLSLRPGEVRHPAGWPPNLNWSRYKLWWVNAQQLASLCIDGDQCIDPYPKAMHWGGDMDSPTRCMVKLPSMGTANTFYSVDLACKRKRRRARHQS